MNTQDLIIGYDLCSEFSQISYYNMEKGESESVLFDNHMQIPTVLCRLFASEFEARADEKSENESLTLKHDNCKEKNGWLAGRSALMAVQEGRGVLVQGFAEGIGENPQMEVDGMLMDKAELMGIFVDMTLEEAFGTFNRGRTFLTLTMEDMSRSVVEALKHVTGKLNIPEYHVSMISHRLSYEYYALTQPRELWMHDVGLFELCQKGLFYHHLSISWKNHPPLVTVTDVDLSHYVNALELKNVPADVLDRQFLAAIREASADKTISTYYLVGEGFEDREDGSNWLNMSLKQLCAMHRHVFVGQNLYVRGACYNSHYMTTPAAKPAFLAVNADILMKDIYVHGLHRNMLQKVMLAGVGNPWYGGCTERYVIIDDSKELVLHIYDKLNNTERICVLELENLPKRPTRTTRLKVQVTFKTPSLCHIHVADMGFGEICLATDKAWDFELDIDDVEENMPYTGNGTVIETTEPRMDLPLEMKMSGLKIYSLEELCWYLSKNVYAISMELFDGEMFQWLDAVTGSHQLTLALHNYIDGGKPLKEIVRFLLTSVDYLSKAELSAVVQKLTDMEYQNPVEQARMAADNYQCYGHYMAALKTYHHAVYLMNHGYADEMTKQFKAETWHNMGLSFMKLHHARRAAECMEKAFGLVSMREYLQAWVRVLVIANDEAGLEKLRYRQGVTATMVNDMAAEAQRAIKAWEDSSEDADKLGVELARRKNHIEDYETFARDLIEQEKKRYDPT